MGKLFNRAGMTVTGTPGTGTITLNAAITTPKKYLDFATSGVANLDVVSYLIEDGVEFEHGIGTYTTAGTTLSRATVRNSSNAGAKISATSAALVYIDAGAEDIAIAPDVQTFNASGTWTKPTDKPYTRALIECWGGGGSGAVRTTTGSAGGGGGGGYNFREVPFSSLAGTETVTIAAIAASVASSNAVGNDGGSCTFGTWLTGFGGGGGRNTAVSTGCSGGGGGGTITAGGSGTGNNNGSGGGGDGSFAQAHDSVSREGGGAGGSISATNVGTVPGSAWNGGCGGGGTCSTGPIDQAGATIAAGGLGGAGGAAGSAAPGGAGTAPGGGGGAARNGQASGAGALGRVVVTSY